MAIQFSVVVPTFNRARLIGESLDAILAQDLPPSEVIVVDDGSTDDTQAVLARYGARIRTLSVSNGGDLVARNIGTRSASNAYVAFCDSDDLWEPGFSAAMAALFEREPHLTCAFADFRILQDGQLLPGSKFSEAVAGFWEGLRPSGLEAGVFDAPSVARLLRFQPFFPSALMVRRDAFLALGGWDEGVSRITGTDFATALRLAEGPIGVVRQPLVNIRKHGDNFSGDVQEMNLGDARILEYVLAQRPALAPLRHDILASVADRRAAAADTAFDRRDFATVREVQTQLPDSHLPLRRRLKGLISRLPAPLAHPLAERVSRRPAPLGSRSDSHR